MKTLLSVLVSMLALTAGATETVLVEGSVEGDASAAPATSLAGVEYKVSYDDVTRNIIFKVKGSSPAANCEVVYHSVTVLDNADKGAKAFSGYCGHTPDPDDIPMTDAGEGWLTFSISADAYTATLGMFITVVLREDDARNLERTFGVSSMSTPNDWAGFDWSWDNRIEIILPNIDLDGQEPQGTWLVDVPDGSEVNPGVLLANNRTRLLVRDPGPITGNCILSWVNPANNKKIQLREVVGGTQSGGWLSSPITIPCSGSWPKTYVVKTTGAWAPTDRVDVVLSHSLFSLTDTVRLTVIRVDFARLWDAHQEANRTTRAIDPALRAAKTYEDSERSDNALQHDSPLLALGGWGNQMTAADVKLQCQFKPATLGAHVLWKIDASVGSVAGASSGDFSASDTIALHLLPSTATMENHSGKDFVVKVGIDQNGDAILSDSEAFPIDWGIRVIGKPEYDHCRSGFPAWQVTFGALLYPDLTDFIDIFLDTDLIASYQVDDPATVSFSGSYDQKNGLGCDPTSLTQGSLRRYTWQQQSGVRQRVLLSDDMWNDAIQPTISAMGIGTWYADPANAAINSKTFAATFSDVVSFAGTANLANSLGKATVSIEVTLDTERATPKPKITAMRITGTVTDLYDFQSVTSDEHNGYASRIQVCYAPTCGRTAGKIYNVLINCDTPRLDLLTPVAYDNLAGLKVELYGYLLDF